MYFRRARRYTVYSLLIYVCACLITLSWLSVAKNGPIKTSFGRPKRIVDTILDKDISGILALAPRSSQAGVKRIQDLQNDLFCSISKGRWIKDPRSGYPWPLFLREQSCSDATAHSNFNTTLDSLPSVDICASLAGKRILFVGPETTFYLHSLWLASLEVHERRPHPCLGHEFCTFHHICREPAGFQEYSLEEVSGRKKKIPSKNTLAGSASSLLQYALSSTLYTSKNQQDKAYMEPTVDEETGIRVANAYWLRRARKSDVIVMNRGPNPAPLTTYAFPNNATGNWTFASNICAQNNLLKERSCHENLETLLVNAALFVTVHNYLPSLLQSLKNITEDGEIIKASLVWQGSWYLQPACAIASVPTYVPLLQDIWSSENIALVDPWTFYYNVQVYMHDRLLRKILPRYNIIFVPLTMPAHAKASLRFPDKAREISGKHAKDCLRQPWPSFGADSLEVAFFSALQSVLYRK